VTNAQTESKLRYQLGLEMARVDALRMKLNPRNPNNTFIEFWMRRAILRAKFSLQQNNMTEGLRMWKLLSQIGHGPS
jgi:hypothetical protein